MGYHIARLIFTIILIIFTLTSLAHRVWPMALFWALITAAVGYPFIQGGKLNLNYDDCPTAARPMPSPLMAS